MGYTFSPSNRVRRVSKFKAILFYREFQEDRTSQRNLISQKAKITKEKNKERVGDVGREGEEGKRK